MGLDVQWRSCWQIEQIAPRLFSVGGLSRFTTTTYITLCAGKYLRHLKQRLFSLSRILSLISEETMFMDSPCRTIKEPPLFPLILHLCFFDGKWANKTHHSHTRSGVAQVKYRNPGLFDYTVLKAKTPTSGGSCLTIKVIACELLS